MDIGDSTAFIFASASVVGCVAFAVTGFLTGVRKRLDLMGVFVLAFLSANGGGVVRDLLVDRMPTIMISMAPFWQTAGAMLLAMLLRLQDAGLERKRVFVVSDAVGLVAFGIHGALIGIEEGLHCFGVISLSFLTATGGGIVRDILVNDIPMVLHEDFYGSVALLLALAVYGLHLAGAISPLSLLAVFVGGLVLRLIARKRRWKLPKVRSWNDDPPLNVG